MQEHLSKQRILEPKANELGKIVVYSPLCLCLRSSALANGVGDVLDDMLESNGAGI